MEPEFVSRDNNAVRDLRDNGFERPKPFTTRRERRVWAREQARAAKKAAKVTRRRESGRES